MLTQVKFSWTDDNQLHINIRATATQPTPANITFNCLMNLAGHVRTYLIGYRIFTLQNVL